LPAAAGLLALPYWASASLLISDGVFSEPVFARSKSLAWPLLHPASGETAAARMSIAILRARAPLVPVMGFVSREG
jgi:hypothetical protein